MGNEEIEVEDVAVESVAKRHVWPVLIAILAPLLLLGFSPYDVSPQKRFHAPAYVAPAGCTITRAEWHQHLPAACVAAVNAISDPAAMGLRSHHKDERWIRIGNDVFDAQCAAGDCWLIYAVHDKLYQVEDGRRPIVVSNLPTLAFNSAHRA